jgi:type II secretory pathway component GspD/PulD (secretin)
MKPALAIATLLVLPFPQAFAQAELVTPPAPPAADLPGSIPLPEPPLPPVDLAEPAAADPGAPALPSAPAVEPVAPVATDPSQPAATQEIQESEEGYLIKDAPLNDIFQFLAKQAGRQYFHNSKIATPEFRVTGHLNDGDPLQQMEELAFMHGLTLYNKGNTIYALSSAQLSQLPSTEFNYRLKYLRSADIENIKALIQPMLTPGTGIVNFEPKTNTVVIIDTAQRIEQAKSLLNDIDQAKGQIVVETKILRVNSTAAERVGVNWSSSLGEAGTPIEIARSLNSIFGIDSTFGTSGSSAGTALESIENAAASNVVLSPMQLNGVLRALAEGNFATQISNPTLITEDNEQGAISIIDRIPIITQTQSGTGENEIVTEEVRYKIDAADKAITEDANNHREIGISLVVTPTLLPDGTIRMKLRPRSAQIAEKIRGTTGNEYPRVTESMIESLSRVPDGHSLVVGGFYGEVENKNRTKVPLLGDIPVINFFFKSRETIKENASLVFIVTPTSYDPSSATSTDNQSSRLQRNASLGQDHDWVDPTCNPGPAHDPNFRRGLRGLRPQEAPYYPTNTELDPVDPDQAGSPASGNRFSKARR